MTRSLFRVAGFAGLVLAGGCGSVVRGIVRDKPTGNPLSSASVVVGDRSATTNAVGAYEVRVDLDARSTLTVNAPGYFMYSASVAKRGDEGDYVVRDVELVPRSEITPRH